MGRVIVGGAAESFRRAAALAVRSCSVASDAGSGTGSRINGRAIWN